MLQLVDGNFVEYVHIATGSVTVAIGQAVNEGGEIQTVIAPALFILVSLQLEL